MKIKETRKERNDRLKIASERFAEWIENSEEGQALTKQAQELDEHALDILLESDYENSKAM